MRVASCLLMWLALSATADELPLVPFPAHVDIHVVGEHLTVNGLPLLAYEYFSSASISSLMDFYRNSWSRSDAADAVPPYLDMRIGKWQVLSHLEKNHNITVQFRNAGIRGTQVLVGISPLPEYLLNGRRNAQQQRIPRLGDTRIASVVAARDAGRPSEVYWLESGDGVDAILSRYRSHFEANHARLRGYRVVTGTGQRAEYGNLIVDDGRASYRFDAVRGIDRVTRIIAIWQPH